MRPIDADALLPNGVFYVDVDNPMKGLDELLDRIINAPTIDYAPVKHGEWKYYHKQNKAVCKSCSFERDLDADFGRAIACPNCGARMDGKEDGKDV